MPSASGVPANDGDPVFVKLPQSRAVAGKLAMQWIER